jgi:ribose transport system permease protein
MIGGLASISGTFIGAMIISMIQEGILAMKFAKDVQLIITAVIVAAAVFIDVSSRRRRN